MIIFQILIALIVFMAIVILSLPFLPSPRTGEAKKRLGEEDKKPPTSALIVKMLFPIARILKPFTKNIRWEEYRKKVQRLIITAGMKDEITVDDFIALKFSFAVFLLLLVLFLKQGIAPLWDIVAVGIGFFFPDLWLRGVAQNRQKAIIRALPYMVDMLTLSVEAGLDFGQGLARVVQKSKGGPLIDELKMLMQEMRMGRTRSEALKAMAERVDVTDISSFVSVLVQADQLGASIGETMRAQADKMRSERFRKAEALGGQAATKLLFPMMVFIFPTIFIVLFGPVVIRFLFGQLLR